MTTYQLEYKAPNDSNHIEQYILGIMCIQSICALTAGLLGMIETFLESFFVEGRPGEKRVVDST